MKGNLLKSYSVSFTIQITCPRHEFVERLRTTTNVYIFALAISDLLSAIFEMPLAVGVLISGRWPFGEALCQVHAFFSLFVVYISPVTMSFTAANRYVRMCKSEQQYKRFFSKWKSRITLACAWAFVTGYIWITHLAGVQDYYFDPGYAACLNEHLNNSARIIHYFVVIGLFFVLPFAITIFSYRKVLKKIQEHNTVSVGAPQRQDGDTTVSRHEIRISRSLFALVFAFMLCWIPSWIITTLTSFNVIGTMRRNFQLLCTFFANLSKPEC
ncbi:pinopsin-like [Orbicella faveolata]|uniref:pinopsin-like n=1 Tax=Orbicella faveolata TaxID=48498 RepID=UPI0009E547FF|nr:pinopsin-like [Orbicella faveolata]